ncbi:hypothetical protein MHU86_2705 [Fragilaria crotonensis]|nr:hypothetical protein MHU86_2705 [Fragilaria crotonensis]
MDIRRIAKVQGRSNETSGFAKTALDSHADTSCAGSNMAVLELTGEKVTVYPFSENLPAVQEVPIATVLTVWENPSTGQPWMLVIHEALYFGDRLKESLLCPNQVRAAGNVVRDVPIQFDAASTTHSITIPGKLELPLELHGVISFVSTRKPTTDEIDQYQSGVFQSVELTEKIPWEPYSAKFAETEDAARSAKTVSAVRVTHDTHFRDNHVDKRKDTVLASTVVDHTLPLLPSVRQPKFL